MDIETILTSIRGSLANDATVEAKAAGAAACRAILGVLDPPAAPVVAQPAISPNVATIVGALRGMPAEQLLDLAIARLRAALPAGAQLASVTPVKFQLVPVASVAPGKPA